ncbi:L-histidine N(alpha)-methyltransferase [Carboxylicivirga sediminis]|uniref:L-histidine N(Alpha)-methyltransferase n=1 Tax=Carboxylicivirga sediminis TaxID=2006564 RepID=A0A941F4H9_9BACT|nr:L-histidine N(alpha)-methyltransferase [Carboxylicivirga sediminis]MBR8535793.1 L-histidine N(alpha)-methyltransferase [Carboxylicivirga sediminis]
MNYLDETIIKIGELEIVNYLHKKGIDTARQEIIEGLTTSPKYISPKYFYDQAGSELFEAITKLDEYYPTRCEMEILSTLVNQLDISLYDLDIIELGSGDSSKIKTLIGPIPPHILSTINYYPVDISQSAITKSIEDIIQLHNFNSITGIVTDFLHSFDYMPRRRHRLFCFLGSTIGNLSTVEAKDFMQKIGEVMDGGDALLLGADMVKDITVLERAYNDDKGVTAAFNKNILKVVNRHVDASFEISDFEHWAFYNKDEQRIEMHLKAQKDINVQLRAANQVIRLKKGETIHSENSHKFTVNQLEALGHNGGMQIKKVFSDDKGWFSLAYYIK